MGIKKQDTEEFVFIFSSLPNLWERVRERG
jgi:hypothetical protein